MPDQSFRSFLANLEQQGELIRFTKEVDPLTNMSAVEWKTFNELGKSSLFTNIAGHDGWTACSQILADRKKWAIGLGLDEGDILAGITKRVTEPHEAVVIDSADAPVREVILTGDDVDLYDIPSMIVSELDGGRYMASGMGIVKDPNTGIRNISIHRQQIMGKDKTGFLMLHRQMRRIYDMYCERDEAMPVAMVYGAHPAIFFGSAYTTHQFWIHEFDVQTYSGGGYINRNQDLDGWFLGANYQFSNTLLDKEQFAADHGLTLSGTRTVLDDDVLTTYYRYNVLDIDGPALIAAQQRSANVHAVGATYAMTMDDDARGRLVVGYRFDEADGFGQPRFRRPRRPGTGGVPL